MRWPSLCLLAFAMPLASSGCTSLDPMQDREALGDDLARRLGDTLPEPPDSELDPTIGTAVRELLREPLTEDHALRIALLNNHEVRAAYERLGIARTDLVQAGLLRNPVFDADARLLFGGGTEIELGLAQPFVDIFYRPLRQRLGEQAFLKARLQITDDLVHLAFAVRRNFVQLRAAQQAVELQRQALAIAEASHELTLALHAAGNTTDQALARQRLGETRARLDLSAAEMAAHEAREPLQVLLGLWGEQTSWTVTGDLPEDALAGLDLDRVEGRAIAASLDLAKQRADLEAAAQQVGLQSWRSWFPEASAGLSALHDPGGAWGLGPRLSLELPLLDDGSSRRTKAAATLRAQLHEHIQQAVLVRSAARLLRDRLVMLTERLRFLREQHLPQRAEVVRTTLQHYNAMQIGAFDVLRERQMQQADSLEYVMDLRDAHLAHLDLRELFAGSLPTHALQPMPSMRTVTPNDTLRRDH